jgi:hypothetical protein
VGLQVLALILKEGSDVFALLMQLVIIAKRAHISSNESNMYFFTGLRCNRVLATPSIVVSDYQDLILIVVFVIVVAVLFIVAFILVRRCCISREHGTQSNAIPLTAARGLKDSQHRYSRVFI